MYSISFSIKASKSLDETIILLILLTSFQLIQLGTRLFRYLTLAISFALPLSLILITRTTLVPNPLNQ